MTTQRQRPEVAARGVEGEPVCLDSTVPGNGDAGPPEPAGPVPEPLIDILRRLADALDRQAAPPRLAYRLSELAAALGVSKRLLEQARAAGRMPKEDLRIGRVSLWKTETVRDWLSQEADRQGRRSRP
jgi:hypothetical protein